MEERSSREPAAPDGGRSPCEDPGREREPGQRPRVRFPDGDGPVARQGTRRDKVEPDSVPTNPPADAPQRPREPAHDPTLSERLLPTPDDDLQPGPAGIELPAFLPVRQIGDAEPSKTAHTQAPPPDPTLSERRLPEGPSPPVAERQDHQAWAPSLGPPPPLTSPERIVPEPPPLARAQEEQRAQALARAEEEERVQALVRAQEEQRAQALARAEEEVRAQALARAEEEERAQALARAEEEERARALVRAEEERARALARAEEEERAQALARAAEEERAQALARAEHEQRARVLARAEAERRAEVLARAEEDARARQSALVEARVVDLGQAVPSAPAQPFRPPPARPPVTVRYRAPRRGALAYLRLALGATLALLLALALFVLGLVVLYRWVDPPASALMLTQRLGGTAIMQRWTPLERISPQLVQAVIASEDARFCRHRGVDWEELEQAIDSARDGLPRGGSTITMQLVKNLFLWPSKSYVRKAIEIPLAYLVEATWSKRRVLEIYLNVAEWGPGVFGAEAAARYHFRKPASLLSAREAALLAVALPNPFERFAGNPGPGTQRLADNLLLRMRGPGLAACVRTPRVVVPAPTGLWLLGTIAAISPPAAAPAHGWRAP